MIHSTLLRYVFIHTPQQEYQRTAVGHRSTGKVPTILVNDNNKCVCIGIAEWLHTDDIPFHSSQQGEKEREGWLLLRLPWKTPGGTYEKKSLIWSTLQAIALEVMCCLQHQAYSPKQSKCSAVRCSNHHFHNYLNGCLFGDGLRELFYGCSF